MKKEKPLSCCYCFMFNMGRAYQIGYSEAVSGRPLMSRENRKLIPNTLMTQYEQYPAMYEEIMKACEAGYVDGIQQIKNLIRDSNRLLVQQE